MEKRARPDRRNATLGVLLGALFARPAQCGFEGVLPNPLSRVLAREKLRDGEALLVGITGGV